jgi:NTE family protein
MIDRDWRRSMVVSRAPLFAGLDAAALEDVLSRARSRQYTAGQLICRQGDASTSVFVLCRGVATAFVTSVTSSSVATVARLRPGDVIGEVGFITHLPRSASVMARSDAVLLEIAGGDFAGLLARHPALLANITQLIAGRLARRNADLRNRRTGEIVALVVETRLAATAAKIISAARLASPHRVAVVDVMTARRGDTGDIPDCCRPASIEEVHRRVDDLSATHGLVVIAVEDNDERLGLLFEHADRVLAVACDRMVELSARLRDAAQRAELVLMSDDAAVPLRSTEYCVVRRCGSTLTPADVAWLGRHVSRTKLGLALGAGGAKSFAHAAVIDVLERAGYHIDYVAGSSMGAVVAVWRALGRSGSDIAAMLRERCSPVAVVDAIFRQGAMGQGVELFSRIFRETTSECAFADLSIPATVMTTDLASRSPAPITTGPLWEALMAALAIPGLYSPWVRGQQRLVDAVSLTPVPVDAVIEAGADITVAVNLLSLETLAQWPHGNGQEPRAIVPSRPRDTVVEVLELAQLGASARETARADVPVTPLFGPGTWRQMELGSLFFDAGQAAAEAQLPLLGKLARAAGGPV